MIIENIQISNIYIDRVDVTELGDPAPRWKTVPGKIEVRGWGFTQKMRTKVEIQALLTNDESDSLMSLLEQISKRIVSERMVSDA